MEKQELLNISVNNLSMSEVLSAIEDMVSNREKAFIVAVNVDVVMKLRETCI